MLQDKAFWLWDFLGRLHPLAVHFPVSLLLFAAVLELFTLRNFNSKIRSGVNALIVAGAISAVISVVLGLLLYQQGDYSGEVLSIHQWTGIGTAFLGAATLLFLYLIRRKQQTGYIKIYRFSLFLTAIGVSVAGHFGASLTHGSDFLSAALPWSKDYTPKGNDNFSLASFQNDTTKLSKQQEAELNTEVRAILAHNCYKCHGAEKVKGDLRLDGKHMAFKGGENGPVIVSGNAEESELYRRINLPADHKDVMPSKGKKLPEKDIATIRFWIAKGAPWPEDGSAKSAYRVARLEPRNPALPAVSNGLSNPI